MEILVITSEVCSVQAQGPSDIYVFVVDKNSDATVSAVKFMSNSVG